MKNFVFLVAFIAIAKGSNAQQTTFKINERVYVYTLGQLNLRDSANATARILAKLNFGDTAYIVENTTINCPLLNLFVKDTILATDSTYNENPINDNLSLQGKWVKVKYKNFVGFVNGIYLSSLPCFQKLERKYNPFFTADHVNDNALNDMHFYLLNKHYGIPKNSPLLKPAALLYKKKYNKKDDVTEISYNKNYADGLLFKYEDSYYTEGAGGYTITITKKGISFAEAIIYGRAFFYTAENVESVNNRLGFFYNNDEKKYTITRYGEGFGCEAEIYKNKKGEWVISFGCGGC
jgi:hypothetical protein